MLVLAEQDVIEDPPFSRLDLISCRNLLIYMGGELQEKLISLFHYTLNQDGFLFLGSSETIGGFGALFAAVDKKWKLYQRKGAVSGQAGLRDFVPTLTGGVAPPRATREGQRESRLGIRELTERALLQQYAPASVVINECGEILYIHGHTGKYLEPASGKISVNILQMAREGLRRELTTAIRKVAAQKEPVHHQGLRVRGDGEGTIVNLTVRLVAEGPSAGPSLILVIFEEVKPADKDDPQTVQAAHAGDLATDKDRDERIAALERELRTKEEYLQTTVEELHTSSEDLTSTNEELQSANEELQSTNEELETAKEELQSINEELTTVNAELQKKIDALSRANNDMNNLLAGTGVGTVFVDRQLRVQHFTPAAAQVINLIQSDIGRPVGHIVSNLVGYDRLLEDIQAVMDSLTPKSEEVQTRGGSWYLMRILPYRTVENAIEGSVITFVEVTEQKRMQQDLRRFATVVRDSSDAVTVQDLEGRILAWNPGAERMYGWTEPEALTMNIRDVIPQGNREEALTMVKRLARAEVLEPYHWQRIAKDGRIVEAWLTATALVNASGETYAIATTERKTG